ncbi:MAG: hypothetical protein BWY06_02607 [Candidatus Latescibacteria bacterium ADurb.Bin168]|nr:MAG: hypothetical protein BWY06_02607 [Candidatus Latescibacteria bacterium ADurb.Bin168]
MQGFGSAVAREQSGSAGLLLRIDQLPITRTPVKCCDDPQRRRWWTQLPWSCFYTFERQTLIRIQTGFLAT